MPPPPVPLHHSVSLPMGPQLQQPWSVGLCLPPGTTDSLSFSPLQRMPACHMFWHELEQCTVARPDGLCVCMHMCVHVCVVSGGSTVCCYLTVMQCECDRGWTAALYPHTCLFNCISFFISTGNIILSL